MKKIALYPNSNSNSVLLKHLMYVMRSGSGLLLYSNVHLFTKWMFKGLFRGDLLNKNHMGISIELIKRTEKKRFCLISLI
jgi:hypothetical protein